MDDQRLLDKLTQELDDLAEPGYPTDRADYSPQMLAHYQARARELRAATFTTTLRWLLVRLKAVGRRRRRRKDQVGATSPDSPER
ncbi:hypothetical protein H0Z60_08525 [Ectothiorhodospiraceae bacterium WFHF3C12]|nr:hypothetical protein [Ectothiorhodospiraceae bacterium WFHF3C12]